MSHLDPDALDSVAARGPSASQREHLEGCAACTQAVQSARGRQRLLGGLTPYTLSEMAFRRVEARLEEQVQAQALERPLWRWLTPVLLGAVATALGVVLVVRDPPLSRELPVARSTSGSVTFHPLTVLSARDARVRGEAGWSALVPMTVLESGSAISGGPVLLAPDEDVAWRFETTGAVSFGGGAVVTIGAGQAVAEVRAPVELLASTRRFGSADALFSVTRVGAEVVLQLARGTVTVEDTLSEERLTLTAPKTMRWVDGARLSEGRDEPGQLPVAPREVNRPWTRLDASAVPVGTTVKLDGLVLGVAPMVAAVSQGAHQLELTPVEGVGRVQHITLGSTPFVAGLEVAAGGDDAAAPSEAAVRRVSEALAGHRPKFAACYEQWLKANPHGRGRLVLSLTVSARGKVTAAEVSEAAGLGLTTASKECLVRTTKRLQLPALGSEATLELPLVLQGQQ